MLHAVIMAGGSGTRFWPASRVRMPKQLLKLAGDQTMIRQTVDRCSGFVDPQRIWVVTNAVQVKETRRQLPELRPDHALVEPVARNTAPCVGLAAICALHEDPDATLFIMPADHVISPVPVFEAAARRAVELVDDNPQRLVLFGVPPTSPATGYGYIHRGEALNTDQTAFRVQAFTEKPQRDVAQQYVDAGDYYWNCGIFCWKARTILDRLREFEPDMFDRLQRLSKVIGTEEWTTTLDAEFPQMHSIAIDCAVLEKADSVCVIESPFVWDDVGSWLAVPRLAGTDADGNTVDGKVRTLDTRNCIIRSSEGHLVATLGMEDCIIIHTPDATLVARREDSERIKDLLELLKTRGDTEVL
ncbi:MAG: mannose-1-phosphate guanylyltransferase [Planctomycetaceae bacterium]